jgi:hypothetical protein
MSQKIFDAVIRVLVYIFVILLITNLIGLINISWWLVLSPLIIVTYIIYHVMTK